MSLEGAVDLGVKHARGFHNPCAEKAGDCVMTMMRKITKRVSNPSVDQTYI